jgi:hypothetical protein
LGAVVVPLLAIGVGGVAWAAWGVHGSGSTQTKAGTAVPLAVISASIAPATLLYPGGTADLLVRIRNDNQFPVTVGSVTRTSKAITTDAAHPGCPGSVLDTTEDDDTFTLNEHFGTGEDRTLTIPNAMRMDASAGNACQGARFSIPISVAGVSG